MVNRYSIFVEDIEPCGFDVLTFESFVTSDLIEQLKVFLDPGNLTRIVEKNYEVGKRHFSYEVLEKRLLPLVESFR